MSQRKVIVVGAGIVGLATARAFAVRGYKVTVLERTRKALGASIRNFGMILPVGQPEGKLYERAMTSRRIWKEIFGETNLWYRETGSLQVAYAPDELDVLKEVKEAYIKRGYELLTPQETIRRSPAIVTEGLKGALYSPDEIIIDPRAAMETLPRWLAEKFKVDFRWGTTATSISHLTVYAGNEKFEADEIYVCSGADFETLYPDLFSSLPLTKCKLQMMRLEAQPSDWRLGPMLCGALSLLHYNSFKVAGSLMNLKVRLENEFPAYIKWGIHVMVSQNEAGELTVGDSHEYGLNPDPFDKAIINELILSYLSKFARFNKNRIIETWHGVYPKLTNGEIDLVLTPEDGVTIVNGLGGAGMTFSFGLVEEIMKGR